VVPICPTRKHLPYSIYVKDVDLDVHIRIFKKAIKENGEIINDDIINLFRLTLKDNFFNGEKNFYRIILIALLHN
jgi:hypothetical protein